MRKSFLELFKEKVDRAAHRNTFDQVFVEYRGDILGATINDMVEKGTLIQVTDRRYKLG